ncbi:MAG TPA: hypothetical protein VJN21_01080 [Candidatus Acidoferrales bacterium]|nr:hypothetical protein [Candidatus Acidoferrales bacterium]
MSRAASDVEHANRRANAGRNRVEQKIGEIRAEVSLWARGKFSSVVASSKLEEEPFQKVAGGSTWRMQKNMLPWRN